MRRGGIKRMMAQRPSTPIMDILSYDGIDRCDKCLNTGHRVLTLIPLFTMFVCDKCHNNWWRRWGFQRFKEMIHYG